MDKIFKIKNGYEVLFVVALNQDWAEEYYYREYKHPITLIEELENSRFITIGNFK